MKKTVKIFALLVVLSFNSAVVYDVLAGGEMGYCCCVRGTCGGGQFSSMFNSLLGPGDACESVYGCDVLDNGMCGTFVGLLCHSEFPPYIYEFECDEYKPCWDQ